MSQKIVKLVIFVIFVIFVDTGYCLNLDKTKAYLLEGDYKQAIAEGEKLIAQYGHDPKSDELYYILGLSYLKDGNYLRASDIFEIILKEFAESRFKEEAKLSLADTYYLRLNYAGAEDKYKEIISNNSSTKLRSLLYYRIMQCALKSGNTQEAKLYLDKIKQEFPLSPEIQTNKEPTYLADIYYTVQVGSFSNKINAQNLTQKLIQKSYPAYIEEVNAQDNVTYRVRVGKFSLRQEANDLEGKLLQEGYPTKIYP